MPWSAYWAHRPGAAELSTSSPCLSPGAISGNLGIGVQLTPAGLKQCCLWTRGPAASPALALAAGCEDTDPIDSSPHEKQTSHYRWLCDRYSHWKSWERAAKRKMGGVSLLGLKPIVKSWLQTLKK